MKYIFYSQSWINQIIVESIIRDENIAIDDIIILTNRNFKYAINKEYEGKMIVAKKIYNSKLKHLAISHFQIKKIENWIEEITNGEKFNCYFPHCHPLLLKLFTKHPNNYSLNFIEEGLISYYGRNQANNILKTRKSLIWLKYFNNKFLKLLSVPAFPKDYTNVYKIGDFAFPEYRHHVQYDFSIVNNLNIKVDEVENLLVLAAFVDGSYKLPLDIYLKKLDNVINYLISIGLKKIHYKFHPSDTNIVRVSTRVKLETIKNQIEFTEISDDQPLELIIIKRKPTVYMFNCSLALYCFQLKTEFKILTKLIDPNCEILNFEELNLSNYYINP
ncbi:hypothetical protein [Marivirga sp.]|uniref:hypothetical protein n=1 Tax=Marivirga sp. TaxID=2018662 RepID=UPI003DA6FAAD